MISGTKRSSLCILKTALFLFITTLNARGQIKYEKLTNDLNQICIKDSLPGLSVALVNANGIIYKNSFGFADIKNQIPYTENTIQNIGSVSKTITAIALMKAIQLKYFTLETDINDILPFKVINPNHPDDKLTIKELTDHTSGIIDNPKILLNTYKFYPDKRDYSKAAFDGLYGYGYQQKISDTSLAQFFYNYLNVKGKYYTADNFGKLKAGSEYSYSNIASALTAYLIEIKSGMSYSQFTTRYILKPLKMNSSGWYLSAIDISKHAKLYYDANNYFPLYTFITYPDGGLKTSVNDLSKYLSAVISGYNGNSKLLSPASYQTMFKAHFLSSSQPKNINLNNRNKGVFWNLYTNGTIGHDGDDPGVSTYLFFNTKTGIGGVFLCNKYLANKQPIIDLLVQATNQ